MEKSSKKELKKAKEIVLLFDFGGEFTEANQALLDFTLQRYGNAKVILAGCAVADHFNAGRTEEGAKRYNFQMVKCIQNGSGGFKANGGDTWSHLENAMQWLDENGYDQEDDIEVTVVAQRSHIGRCRRMAKVIGFKVASPKNPPATFAPSDPQWWVRGKVRWWLREIPTHLYFLWRGCL
jgi:hypothetical protein